jgi:hypothetical protein
MRSRLGDDIDDFCVKCKRVMNHLVVSLLNDEPAKVRCRTCHGDHDFRHEQAPPPKIDARKAALIQQALEKAAAAAGGTDGAGIDEIEPVEAPLAATMAASVTASPAIVDSDMALPDAAIVAPQPVAARTAARKAARTK